jgi:hypothetical protein
MPVDGMMTVDSPGSDVHVARLREGHCSVGCDGIEDSKVNDVVSDTHAF